MSKVLVTGAGGYVGGRLIRAFQATDHDVHAFVREPTPRLDVEQSVGDLARDTDELRSALDGAEVIVHLAGENEVMAAREPAAAMASTVVSTEKLVEMALDAGVKRLVYMSTVHVYGDRMLPGTRLEEGMRPEPRSIYAISRLASEHVAATINKGDADLVTFRLTNSVGAPDHPEVDRWTLVANDLSRSGATRGFLELRSSGLQWRDFVPLSDVCEAIVRASDLTDGAVPAGTYNLGSGEPTTVRRLAEMIQESFERQTGSRPELRAPDPDGEAPDAYTVAVDGLEGAGIHSTSPLSTAVDEIVSFCIEHRKELG